MRPPLLARLPPAVPWELRIAREDLVALESIERFRGRLLASAAELPSEYLEACQLIVTEGRQVLARASKRSSRKIPDLGFSNSALGDTLQLSELLGLVCYTYLNRRDRGLSAFLEKSFCRLMLFRLDQELDCELLTAATTLPAPSREFIAHLDAAVSDRFLWRHNEVYRPLLRQFVAGTKDSLRTLRDSDATPRTLSVFKQRIFHVLGATAESIETLGPRLRQARVDLDGIFALASEKLGKDVLTRARSQIDNLLEKLDQFDTFFDHRFCLRELAALRPALERLFGRTRGVPADSAAPLATARTLWLQPAKDYREYRKGEVSGDCTTVGELAALHLRHPRFFNIRIFTGESLHDWRGNIYCLDYSDLDEPTVVLDRVQISRSEQLVPLKFFPSLLAALDDGLFSSQGVRILAPRNISNYGRLTNSYSRFLKQKRPPLVPFTFEPGDKSFLCSRERDLYVLKSNAAVAEESL